jgi:hypothetical protein
VSRQQRGWITCDTCGRKIARLAGQAGLVVITEADGKNRRRPVPTPDNIAETAAGATVGRTTDGLATATCPRGHRMIWRPAALR